MKKSQVMTGAATAIASVLLILSTSLPVYATTFSGIPLGNWVMTQASTNAPNQARAPQVIACGTFTLGVATYPTPSTFTGTLSFTLTSSIPNGLNRLTIPGIYGVSAESISGTILSPPNGALFVSFSGKDPVLLFGSLSSPSSVPSPSIDPTQLAGCVANAGGGFLGLVHLPGQGTEGMTIYEYTS